MNYPKGVGASHVPTHDIHIPASFFIKKIFIKSKRSKTPSIILVLTKKPMWKDNITPEFRLKDETGGKSIIQKDVIKRMRVEMKKKKLEGIKKNWRVKFKRKKL
jgi:hypothetical protein